MRLVLIIRKGVNLEKLISIIEFIDTYKNGILKAVFLDEKGIINQELVNSLSHRDVALMFLGTDSSNSNIKKEISTTNKLGMRRAVFTLDEKNYPPFSIKGIPSSWKVIHTNYIQKASNSNILRAIMGATKWGI